MNFLAIADEYETLLRLFAQIVLIVVVVKALSSYSGSKAQSILSTEKAKRFFDVVSRIIKISHLVGLLVYFVSLPDDFADGTVVLLFLTPWVFITSLPLFIDLFRTRLLHKKFGGRSLALIRLLEAAGFYYLVRAIITVIQL